MMLSNMHAWILKLQIPGVLSRCSFSSIVPFLEIRARRSEYSLKRNFFQFLWFSHQLLSRRGRWCVASRVLDNSEDAFRKNHAVVGTIMMVLVLLKLNWVVVSPSELLGSFVKSGQVAFPRTKKWLATTSSDGDHDWGLNCASPSHLIGILTAREWRNGIAVKRISASICTVAWGYGEECFITESIKVFVTHSC